MDGNGAISAITRGGNGVGDGCYRAVLVTNQIEIDSLGVLGGTNDA